MAAPLCMPLLYKDRSSKQETRTRNTEGIAALSVLNVRTMAAAECALDHGVVRHLVPGVHVEGGPRQRAGQVADQREAVDGAVPVDRDRVHEGAERQPVACQSQETTHTAVWPPEYMLGC